MHYWLPIIAIPLFQITYHGRALDQYSSKPKLWRRCVEDTFFLWKHRGENLNRFQEHSNNIEESKKFTMGVEENKQISFLDV